MKQSQTKSWSLLLMHQLKMNCTCNLLRDQQHHNTRPLAIQHRIAYHLFCLFINQIKVSNSALISAFMTELEPETPVTQVCYDIYLPEILLAILNLVCVFIYFCVIAV